MKRWIFIWSVLFFGLAIPQVQAEVYKFDEKCGNSTYQCIACEYEATNVNKSQHIVLYASSNGKGNITLSHETFSWFEQNQKRGISTVIWDVSSESLKFVDNQTGTMKCPEVWMKHDGAGNSEKISVHFGTNSSTQSQLIDQADNGKKFLEDNQDLSGLTCPDIPVYIYGAGVVGEGFENNFSTKNYSETTVTGTIVKGETPHLELPAGYEAVSSWKNVDDSLIEKCDSNLIIACTEQNNQSYQTSYVTRTCYLQTKDDLSERVNVDADKKPVDDSDSKKDDKSFTPAKLCEDDQCDISVDGFCNHPHVKQTLRFIGIVLVIAKILVPILIIGMGVVNLVQVIIAGKDEEMKKHMTSVLKRLIVGVAIFLLPGIIDFIYDTVSSLIGASNSNTSICENCILDLEKCKSE